MARGINKVILVGNLGADPETRYTPSGTAITNIRVATTESWKDRQSGEHRAQVLEVAFEDVQRGTERQAQVRSRVAVRYRENVDAVQLVPIDVGPDLVEEQVGVEHHARTRAHAEDRRFPLQLVSVFRCGPVWRDQTKLCT